jgi:translation initiation factor IF-3
VDTVVWVIDTKKRHVLYSLTQVEATRFSPWGENCYQGNDEGLFWICKAGGPYHPPLGVWETLRRWRIINKDLRVNEEIRAREARIVGSDGQQLGIMPVKEGLRIAMEQGLDLVEVAPHAKPPVCRIMDYGKYKYEQSKRERDARKKQRVINIKELKIRPGIEEHDFQVKVRSAQRFLSDGDKVKVTLMFRGREISHAELGHNLCMRFYQQLENQAIMEKEPRVEGRNMIMILAPRPQEQVKGD